MRYSHCEDKLWEPLKVFKVLHQQRALCLVSTVAGSDGQDCTNLRILVDETVALISLRNTGTGLPLRPQVADFWIRWTPETKNIKAQED